MAGDQDGSTPNPKDEDARVAALAQYGVVGSNPETEYDHIAQLAADVFNAPIALVSFVDRDRQWLKARIGFDACETPKEISFCALTIASEAILCVPDATQDRRFSSNPFVTGEHHVRFYAGAPLVTPAGFRIGTLCIIDVEPRPALTAKQESTPRRLAGMVIDQLEQRRPKSIKRGAASLLSATSGAIICADARGLITTWNRAAETLFGYGRHEVMGQPYDLVFPRGTRGGEAGSFPHLRDAAPATITGRMFEGICLHKSGREFPVEMSFAKWGEGEELFVGAIIRDITERKEREASIRLLFEASPVPMWLYDVDTLRFLAVNETAQSHYGYTENEFLVLTLLDIRPPGEREAVRAKIRTMVGEQRDERMWRHVKADGSSIDVLTFGRPMPYQGKRARLVAIIDVTERKRAIDELRNTRKFLDTVIESIPATVFVKSAQGERFILMNRAGEELLGVRREEVIGKTSFDLFPGEHAERYASRDRDTLASGQVHIGEEEAVETPTRGMRVLRTTKIPIMDEAGAPQYLLGISEDLTERKHTQERLNQLAWFDQLTSLPNRASLERELSRLLPRAGEGATVLLLGIDRFRHVNESYGRAAGDEFLKAVASRLSRCVGEAGQIFRLSGDHFAVLLPGQAASCHTPLVERFLESFEAPLWATGHTVHSRASIGIAVGPGHGPLANDLMAAAELALQKAKSDGGRCHRVFEDGFRSRVQTRNRLEDELRRAVHENEFELFYQPQVRLSDGVVVGAEALIRWRHPEQGLLAPGAFLPVLDASELAAAVGHWTIRTAARHLGKLRLAGLPDFQIGVNLFGAQLRSPELFGVVSDSIVANALPYSALELEITENILLKQDEDEVIAPLRALRDLGVGIAFDDYGTGFASLSLLKRFPLTRLKIDRSFVGELAFDKDNAAIVKAVLGLGQSLDLRVIAEGIETGDQARLLEELGCAEGQGYHFGRPMPGLEFDALLAAAGQRRAA